MKVSLKKTIHLALILLLASAVLLSACGKEEAAPASAAGEGQPEVSELRYQGWTGSVSFPELAEDLGYLAPLKLKYIGNTISGPQDIQSVVTGDTDFGGAFNGAIVKLIAAKAEITSVLAYYGSDESTWTGYYALDDSPIKTARDLIGKKVGMNTLGGHHEAVIKEYLYRAGLTLDEIKQVTLVVVPPVSTEQALRDKQIDIASLGGILRDKALERGGIHPLFKDTDLFGVFSAGSYVLSNKFIKKNPNATRLFVEATAKAIEWARVTPTEEVVARYESIINKRGRKEDASSVKYWRSTGVAGKGGLISDKEFDTWINWFEAEGSLKKGQVKAADLYTNEFSPYLNESK
ncbi:ABC transporter substrate-binding protein [Paenibacillus sp. LPE1-1-1.1]|uniref:ABC transporter substrate-binding protein n=1 Tax=Paenibacillus sp. LPE1-1-1.1 TaxID=3135230 RepID=UPI00343F5336